MAYSEPREVLTGYTWSARDHQEYVLDNFAANPPAMITTAGDLAVATAANTITRLGIGTNTQMLESRSTEDTGRKWVNSGLVPLGGILIWSGSAASIPTGWSLCNGTGGTPDLRDKFIVCSGSTYATTDTGGAASLNAAHTHTTTNTDTDASTHSHATDALTGDGDHRHVYTSAEMSGPSATENVYATGGGPGDQSSNSSHTHVHPLAASATDGAHDHTFHTSSDSGSHTHPLTEDETGSAGGTIDLRPAYYALCYVMRTT